jgi:hypothetical protein
MPTIPYHHLYNIDILVINPRRVVDAFDLCFLIHVCRLLSLTYSTILLSLRAGPSIAVSRTSGPGFATFSSTGIYFVLYLYHFIRRCSMLHTFSRPRQLP